MPRVGGLGTGVHSAHLSSSWRYPPHVERTRGSSDWGRPTGVWHASLVTGGDYGSCAAIAPVHADQGNTRVCTNRSVSYDTYESPEFMVRNLFFRHHDENAGSLHVSSLATAFSPTFRESLDAPMSSIVQYAGLELSGYHEGNPTFAYTYVATSHQTRLTAYVARQQVGCCCCRPPVHS